MLKLTINNNCILYYKNHKRHTFIGNAFDVENPNLFRSFTAKVHRFGMTDNSVTAINDHSHKVL